ncbi:MAG: AAA family ATPase [Bacteroidales bacterium]|nr:AAA family ATPase [Bacteroidales bacterium]
MTNDNWLKALLNSLSTEDKLIRTIHLGGILGGAFTSLMGPAGFPLGVTFAANLINILSNDKDYYKNHSQSDKKVLDELLSQNNIQPILEDDKLTPEQKEQINTLADNKKKVVALLTDKDFEETKGQFVEILEETKDKKKITKSISNKIVKLSKDFERQYESKKYSFKLDEIYINDYRILKDFKIKFDSNISILIGENGSGKSTLIEYISNAFARMFLNERKKDINLSEYELGKFKFKYTFNKGDQSYYVTVKNETDYFDPIYETDSPLHWPDRFVVSYSGITDRLKTMVKEYFEDTFVKNINSDGSKYSIAPNEFYLPKNRFYYADILYLNFIYCALLFSKNDEANNLLQKINVDFADCEIKFVFGKKYEKLQGKFGKNIAGDFFQQFQSYAVGNNSFVGTISLQDMFHEFKQDISSQEVFDILYYLKLNDLIEDIKISWKNESGSFDLEHISEGQKQELLTLGLSLVFDSPNTLFLLDEPDTYLHPKWQREFISSLSKALEKGGCAIVTTHSPLLLGNAENAQVNILEKGKILNNVPKYYGRTVSDILYELMGGVEEREPEITAKLDKLSVLLEEGELKESERLYDELSFLSNEDAELYGYKILIDALKEDKKNETNS